MRNKQKGFIIPLIIIIAVVLITGGGVYVYLNKKSTDSSLVNVTGVENNALSLNDKINLISPENTSEKRTELLKQIDSFTKQAVNGKSWTPDIYSLIKIRLDQALKEIPTTIVPKGKVKIWYIYNMGIIAKSEDMTIAFDLAGTYVYPNMPDFAKYIDILFITHFHNDHFDQGVVSAALKNGVMVVIPDEKVRLEGNQLIKDDNGENVLDYISRNSGTRFNNLIAIKPQEKKTIKGVEIIAYPANHIGPAEDNGIVPYPLDWYYVNLSGLKILHAGDGTSFNYPLNFTNQNIDVFIFHSTTLDPLIKDTLSKLVPNPKNILPLHVLELGHGSDIVNEKLNSLMTYKSVLNDYSGGYYNYDGVHVKTRFLPMIWGESILF